MTSFIEINGKKYDSVSVASKQTGYSRDYIGRLAREQKILATQVGRQWFVSVASLKHYAEKADDEQKARKEKLRIERKREREIVEQLREKESRRIRSEQKKRFGQRVLAGAVLSLGLVIGTSLNSTLFKNVGLEKLVASAPGAGTFLPSEQSFPIATGETVEYVVPDSMDFSNDSATISALDAEGKGVLLLPRQQNEDLSDAEIKKLFSDPVHIVKDEQDNQYVVRKKSDGTEERVLFTVVPVVNQNTP